MPLFLQLAVLMTVITSLLIGFLLVRDYQQNKKSVLEQHLATSNRVLKMEMRNLEQYIRELASFCLQPRYDAELKNALSTSTPFSPEKENYIRDAIRGYWFSRSDLRGYRIYFCGQDCSFGRVGGAQHVTRLDGAVMLQKDGIERAGSGRYYNAILPSADEQSFFSYYQSIIQIRDRSQKAVVRVDVDIDYAQTINAGHESNHEFLCVLNDRGELLFSGNDGVIEKKSGNTLRTLNDMEDGNITITQLNGEAYLGVLCTGEKYGLKLLSLLPMSVVRGELLSVLKSGILFGILLWMLAVLMIIVILQLAIRPLIKLSGQMKRVGDGNFSLAENAGGSREVADLTESFNDMVTHIDRLIQQNYLSEINEKTLRLTALEAQINPHFLYNTLQAIGSDALINGQPQINEMITSLAANLRYSIKGGDLVTLKEEMTYTENYILLQKIRLEERLNVLTHLEVDVEQCRIPKISIQTLVENSILHGMGDGMDSIFIMIRAKVIQLSQGSFWEVTVADDGCGIDAGQLAKMQEEFKNYLQPGSAGKIGLANLYSRLQILYQGRASLEIRSQIGEGTDIIMRIPVEDKEGKHAESVDCG
ncbi:MAG: sensor histidine kinase [Eubacteriales bacterium]|nr:sensor histidine kinase [Eubacteriales bacterium]